MRTFLFSVFFILVFSFTLSFAGKKGAEPVVIEADRLTFNQKENKAIYEGDVKANKGDLTIKSDKMVILLTKNGDVNKIIAEGNVEIRKKPDKEGKAKKAIYDKNKDTLTLIGNASLRQGKNYVIGDEIVYHIKDELTEVKSGRKKQGRVKTYLFPKEKNK